VCKSLTKSPRGFSLVCSKLRKSHSSNMPPGGSLRVHQKARLKKGLRGLVLQATFGTLRSAAFTFMRLGTFSVGYLTLFVICCLCPEVFGQASYGRLVYADDFSTSNAVWKFKLIYTQENQAAMDASFGKIDGGVLTVKANVDCGWDYLGSFASLQMPLPPNYIIGYRARKTQYCGAFHFEVGETNDVGPDPFTPNGIDFSVAGTWFNGLDVRSPTNNVTVMPASVAWQPGRWYNFRITRQHSMVQVYVDDALQYSHRGAVLAGGFLHFFTGQAGATAEVDDLRIYELANPLLIETAAVRLRWFAESNVTYNIQWSPDLKLWSNVTTVVGNGQATNWVDWNDGVRRFYRYTQEVP
jgi:hypothetical protein